MKKDDRILFPISEAAHACGLSRSTLMRMEEKGLLTPACVAPESGRRYYDNHNVGRILQIEKFKAMGLDAAEITAYFAQGGEVSSLLAALDGRLQELQRSVEELRLRAAGEKAMSVQMMTLPAVTCRISRCEGHTIAEKYAASYALYAECIEKGCVLSGEPLFTMSDRRDYLEGYIGTEPYPFYSCVPLRPETAPEDAVTLPEQYVLSVLFCGSYDDIDAGWLRLGSEARARGLKPAGMPRVLGLVAPYTGREIEQRRYCSRLVLPVER